MRSSPLIKVSHSETDSSQEKVSNWLTSFVSQMQNKITAIEAAKQRDKEAQDYNNQIRTMLGSKPRFATVEDVVKDYAEKTGLNIYINKVKEAEIKKKLNKSANVPAALKNTQHDVEKYILSLIQSKNGVSVQVTPIQFSLVSMLKLKTEDVFNKETADYIKDLIDKNSKQLDRQDISGALGKAEKNPLNNHDDTRFLPTLDTVKSS